MSNKPKTYDVFLSYALSDRPTAEKIARVLTGAGLDVFDPSDLESGADVGDAVWRALGETEAFLAILPSDGAPSANNVLELGAAMAWRKPIFVVSPSNGNVPIPSYLAKFAVYPTSRIVDIVNAIRTGKNPLSRRERDILGDLYVEMRTPTDQLLRKPALLEELALKYSVRAKSPMSGERLLNEMMRLRKRGGWPAIKAIGGKRTGRVAS